MPDSLFVASNGQRVLTVDEREFSLIVTALVAFARKVRRDARQSKAKGFTPEPGHVDINAVRGKRLIRLMDRLGIDRKGG